MALFLFRFAMRYWLMKTEPHVFSFDDLLRLGVSPWEGVRNYQARNFMKNDMRKGDLVLLYHSNATPPGIAGIARVCKESYPDWSAWQKNHKYFDPKSPQDAPRWFMVDVEPVVKFPTFVSLAELKENPLLCGMLVTKRGCRLSVQPVEAEHFDAVCALAKISLPR